MKQSDSSSSEELSVSGKRASSEVENTDRMGSISFLVVMLCPCPGSSGSWVWNVTEKAKSLLVQREASTLNTLLFIYLIL